MANNPYDEVYDQTFGKEESQNPYNQIAEQQEQASTFAASEIAATKDPDRHAKVLTLAEKMGAQSDFVDSNYEAIEKQRESYRLKGQVEESRVTAPATAEFMSNPDNLALSKDDLDHLTKLEKEKTKYGFWSQAWSGFKSSSISLGSSLAKSPSYIAVMLNEMERGRLANMGLTEEEIDMGRPKAQDVAEFTKFFRENQLVKDLDAKSKELRDAAPMLNQSTWDAISSGNLTESGQLIALQVIANSPSTLGILAAASTGYGAAGLTVAGLSEASSSFAENVDKPGVTAEQAAGSATMRGSFEAAFESLGTMGILKQWEKALTKELGKQTSREVIKNTGKTLAYSFLAEGNEEAATSIAQDFADYVTGVNKDAMKGSLQRAFDAGIVGGFTGVGLVSPAAVSANLAKQNQIRQSKQDQQLFEAIGENAENSKLKQRLPEKYQELVEHLTKDGPIEKVYISQEGFTTLFQSKNMTPEQVAAELGISQEYSKAVETGSDIEVSTAVMASKVAGTEYYQSLKNDIKFQADGLTQNEIKQQEAEDKAALEEEYNKAKEGKTEEEVVTVESSAREVAKDIEEQLKKGGMSPKEAKNNSKIWEAQFRMLGLKTGQMPADIYKEYGVKINFFDSKAEMPVIDTATIYNQATNEILTSEVQEDESITFKSIDGKSSMNMRLSRGTDGMAVVDVNQFNYDPELTSNTSALLETAEKLAVDNGSPLVVFSTRSFGANADQAVEMLKFHGYRPVKRRGQMYMQKAVGGAKELYQKKDSPADRKAKAEALGFDTSKVYYHGTNKTFDTFKSTNEKETGDWGEGFYFTPSESDAKFYAEKRVLELGGEQNTIPVYLKIKNPYILERWKRAVPSRAIQESKKFSDSLLKNGYDAILVKNRDVDDSTGQVVDEWVEEVVVFNSNQIKSVDAKFDEAESGNIYSQDIRGQIRFGNNRQFNIDLFKTRDESTFLHESAHFFFEVYGDFAEAKNAPQSIKDDYQKMLEHVGVKSRSEVGTDQHEIFARSFEAYMMEGKSPSEALKKVFHTFKNWLISVYRQASGLNVQMTDEIRGVFDRMLATEEEIELAKSNLGVASIFQGDPRRAGLSEEETLDYLNASAFAAMDAKDELRAKVMKDLIRTKDKAYKAKYDEISAAEMAKAQEMPEFKALAAIKGELKLSKEIIDQQFSEFKKTIPRGSSVKGEGVHPDVVAQMFGYANGQELLSAIAPYYKGIDAYVESRAAEEIKKTYPELLESPELSEEAMRALHNENYRKLKRMELKHLATNDPQVLKTVASKLIRRMPSDKAVKEQAVKLIAATNVRDIKPHIYRNNEKKFSIQAAKFYKQGEFEKAFEAKRKEYLNFELYLQAMQAKEDVKKSLDKFKKMFRKDEDMAKSRDVDLVNAAKAILAEFGIVRADKTAEEYLKSMKQYDPETYAMVKALYDSATAQKGNYENVTYDVFVEMRDSVDALYDLAKSRREIQIDGKKMSIDKVKEELITQIDSIAPEKKSKYEETATKFGKFKVMLLSVRATLTRAEAWTKAMDVKDNGPFHKYIYQPMSDASVKYRIEKANVTKKYKKLLEDYRSNLTNDKIVADDLKFIFKDKAELMMAVLHSGNESNLKKLLLGRNWGDQNADGTLNTENWDRFIKRMIQQKVLTKADFDFAQSVWDLLESLKPESQKAHKEMFGYYFNEITAKEISVDFGEGPVKFRGGYVPAKADIYEVEDASIRQEREQFENNNNSFQFPTTGKGFTKSRVDNYTVPLSLDMNLLGGHIDGVLRFTYVEPRVKEVSRIVLDPGFRRSMTKIDSEVSSEMLVPFLQRVAQQQTVLPSATGLGKSTDATARFLRKTTSTQIMMGNVTNTLQQVTGLIVAMSKVKPKYIRNALAKYISNNRAIVESVMEKSDWMRVNQDSSVYEVHQQVKQILINPTTFEKANDFVDRHRYFLQAHAQNMVNTVVWVGAYDQYIEQGMTELEAIKNADSVVRTTQGTTNPEDISRFETGTATEMLFKQFVSYFNMLANLNASEIIRIQRDVGLRKGMGRGFYLYLTAFMLPAVLSDIIVRAMGDNWDDDDDDEYLDDAMMVFFGSQFKTATATVPYVGQLGVAAYNKAFTKNIADDRLSLSPVLSIVEAGAGVPAAIYQDAVDRGELKKKTIKDSLQMIGIMTGLPTGPLGRPVGYLMDVESGKADPTGPIDFGRGLITGKSGN